MTKLVLALPTSRLRGDDDEAAGAACAAVGLHLEGRPQFLREIRANQQDRLDGRWRSRELAAAIGFAAQRLDAELGRLADAIDAPVPGG
jgi:hypothetical protein